MSVLINTIELGEMDNFIHTIVDQGSGEAFVVDPSWDADAIELFLDENDFTLAGILLTHSHADHISALDDLLLRSEVPVYVSFEEFRLGFVRVQNPTFIKDGDILALGETTVTAIATPGHTVGSMCYLVNDTDLIAGDTLFIDGCGRCNFLESDVEQMYDSLQRLKTLPDTIRIHAGHHYAYKEVDTLGNQKNTNPYLLIDDKAFFIEFRMNLQAEYRSIPFEPSSKTEMTAIRQQYKHLR